MNSKIWTDPIVEEVRKAGEELAREAGYDLRKLCRRIYESQKRHGEKLVYPKPLTPNKA